MIDIWARGKRFPLRLIQRAQIILMAAAGVLNHLLIPGWERWRAEPARFEAAFSSHLDGTRFPVGYEIVYGTAFGPRKGQRRRTAGGDVVTFSVDSLLKSRPMG